MVSTNTEKGPNNKEQYTIVALYVDDLIIATSVKDNYKRLESEFQTRFSVKILGSLKHIPGMDVHYEPRNSSIHVSQSQYIKQSVKAYNKYGPSGMLKPYSTPMDSRVFYKNSSIKLPKRQKKQVQIRMRSHDQKDSHTHASNDSYEHPPR